MKRIKVVLVIMMLLFPQKVYAQETQEEIQDAWLEKFDFNEMDGFLSELFPERKLSFRETLTGLITGEHEFTLELLRDLILDQLFYEVKNSKDGMLHMLLIVIVAAVFSNFSGVFRSTQVAEISFTTLYMLLLTICLGNFRILVDSVGANIGKILEFMSLLGPVYFMAVALSTGSSTSIVFYQIILFLIYIVEVLVQNFLLPITQIYLIMRFLSEFSPEIHLSKCAELLETVIGWSLKTLLAAVIGVNVIQGLLAPAIDTVKRSVVTRGMEAVPIVGDALGGVTEVVLGTAVLIKNGIGVVGMILCLLICVIPMIQMAVTSLTYQLTAALVQPISDKRMVNCISSMADGTKILLKIVFTTGALFLVTIAVVATTTGGK